MLRSLFTAATGMTAQQQNIDVIANNLANVNTTGFKRARADFQDLLYQTLREPGAASSSQTEIPTGIQLGLGVRAAAVQRLFLEGDFQQTQNQLDITIGREFRVNRTRLTPKIELFNLLNVNPVLAYNANFSIAGPPRTLKSPATFDWPVPTTILQGRLTKVGFQFDF